MKYPFVACVLVFSLGCSADDSSSQAAADVGGADLVQSSDMKSTEVDTGADIGSIPDLATFDAAPDLSADLGESPDASQEPDMCTGECTYQLPNCDIADVERTPGNNWFDSYSADGKCYCDTTFDHNIGDLTVETPAGMRTVRQVCDAIGPGPGREGNPVYNDIQCGNGPANDAGDEDWCPGRVDQGREGCCTAGPRWDFTDVQL